LLSLGGLISSNPKFSFSIQISGCLSIDEFAKGPKLQFIEEFESFYAFSFALASLIFSLNQEALILRRLKLKFSSE